MWKKFKQWFDVEPVDAIFFAPQTVTLQEQKYLIRRMTDEDISAALEVERMVYHQLPWDRLAFLSELRKADHALYLVVEVDAVIIGFIGCWFGPSEAHVTNIAVAPSHQHRGLGRYLMQLMVDEAISRGALEITLEVRMDNVIAQNLYHSLGFEDGQIRHGYYVADHEDALNMRKSLQ